jgi:sialic acid synthase SpsE
MSSPIHVIAEAGTNHNANLNRGKELIEIAGDCGADSVKFQIIYPEGLYISKLWQEGQCVDNEVIAMRRAGMLSDDDYRRLGEFAREKNIPLSASVFDKPSLELLNEFDPPYIKIASCDLNNSPLLKQAAEYGRKLIISTGMSTLEEVEQAVNDITSTGHQDLVIMHCVSVYPCPTENMNLGFIQELKANFGFEVGLSDHSENSLAAAAAIAMGVTWIEKHFTWDRTATGFDHAYAMEAQSLTQYIQDIRQISQAMQTPETKVNEIESSVKVRARRALYASRDLTEGDIVTEQDVLVVRPEGPMQPNELPLIVGQSVCRPVRQYEAFQHQQFQQA